MGTTITNVNELGHALEIVDTGQTVAYGADVEVDPEVAGSPPSGEPGDEKYEPGAGLLAQPSNWARSTTNAAKEARAAAKRRSKPDPEPDDTNEENV